jgi:tight adherence protein B
VTDATAPPTAPVDTSAEIRRSRSWVFAACIILLCVWVLLPIYLLLVNRDYVMPMFTDPKGWLMLAGGVLLLGVGIFWMSRLVKVEV